MERSTNDILLDCIDRPAFCVRDGVIVQANHAAQQRAFYPQAPISGFLAENGPVYSAFSGGSLYLTLSVQGIPWGASVTRDRDTDIFLLDEDMTASLQTLALSAQQLRMPLQTAFVVAEELRDERGQGKLAGELSRSLYQMHRILCNMADTYRYNEMTDVSLRMTDLTGVFRELMEKCAASLQGSGFRLLYDGLYESVIGLAAPELLERAVYNLLSNAVKFSETPGTLKAGLHRTGGSLCFTMQNEGGRIPPEVLSHIFSRYLRGPGIEDGRYGIGLGLALVRAAAVTHGGTVLIDQPGNAGVRVTMTLAVRQEDPTILRSPVSIPSFDYAGGYDHALVELSDILPAEAFQNN